jgi:hypothetical protein
MAVLEEHSPQSSAKSVEVSNVDESYDIYAHHVGDEVSSSEAKKVLRKIDVRLIPILFLLYFLQYLDKNGINYASVYGLQEGTNLKGNDYSWLSSIFYFGYMAGKGAHRPVVEQWLTPPHRSIPRRHSHAEASNGQIPLGHSAGLGHCSHDDSW